jgi:hypothetical protein
VAQTLSNNVANNLTHVSVPAEDIKHGLKGSSTFVPTHAPSRPALAYPSMPIMDQYFHTHFNVLQAKHKQPNFINNKKAYTGPNSSTKATNNQIRA